MIPFNYHHLYYFYVIAKEGSISKATEQLRLAQPTLSAQLKQFENFLNTPLFIRDHKHLILTEEGHKVLSYAKLIFDIGQELKGRMVDLNHQGKIQLQIGVSNLVPKTMIDLLLDFILKNQTDVVIRMEKDSIDKLVRGLEDRVIDIVLTDSPFEKSLGKEFHCKYIGQIPIVFCAHPNLARNIKKFPKDLSKKPLLLPAMPHQIAYRIKEFLHEHHVEPNVIGEIQDVEIIRRLALRGHGIAAINELTVKEAPSKQRLVILNSNHKPKIYEKAYILTKKRKQTLPIVDLVCRKFSFY
jgi:LysR family transcriptional regulator, transcriptional activator of nhaA